MIYHSKMPIYARRMYGFISRLGGTGGGGACWLLSGGTWNDSCFWVDSESWED